MIAHPAMRPLLASPHVSVEASPETSLRAIPEATIGATPEATLGASSEATPEATRWRLRRLRRLLQARGLVSLFWLGGEKLLQLGFSVVSVGLIARALGVDAFGEFQYVLSMLFVFSAVGLIAGSEVAAPRLAALHEGAARRQWLGSLFVVRLGAGALAFLLLGAWSLGMAPPHRQTLLLILGASLLVAEPFNVLRLMREVGQRTRVITATRLLVSGMKLAAIAALYGLQAPLVAFVAVYSLEYFLIAGCYLYAIRDEGLPWHWQPVRAAMGWLLRKGLLVWVGIQALMLVQRLDRLVLHGRLSEALYGQYAAALGLLDSAWFFGPIAVVALAPSLVYRAGADRPWCFMALLTGLGLLVALAAHLLAPWIIPLIFGAHFAPAVGMLRTAAFVLVPGFAALSLDAVLIQAGRHRVVPLKWTVGLVVGAALIVPDLHLSWWQGPLACGAGYTASLLVGLVSLQRNTL